MVALKRRDPAAFETLRSRLKDVGVRVSALDDAIFRRLKADGDQAEPQTQADILFGLVEQRAQLFHTPDGTAYADIAVDGHRETRPVASRGFRLWLLREFHAVDGGAPKSEALLSALHLAEAKARFDGPEHKVWVRTARLGERLYMDLADTKWRAIEIDQDGWRIVDTPPVRFRRASGMLPLPEPARGGKLDALRPHLNVSGDEDWVLTVAWLLAALKPEGPYPVLALNGEQGSAKSTFAGVLRSLVDPNTVPLRSLPREDRDLFIAASNGHVLLFDNISGLSPWIADTLCRLSTGGGFATRQLYTDGDEVLFDACRPIILNGIEDYVSRQDLADRSLFLHLEAIDEKDRRPDAEVWKAIDAIRPAILGALLDTMVVGLRRHSTVELKRLPRLADFAKWAVACEPGFAAEGAFIAAFESNRAGIIDTVIENDAVAAAVRTFMATRPIWRGSATQLLEELAESVGDRAARAKSWPADHKNLSGRLRRAATFLRKAGVGVEFERTNQARLVVLTREEPVDGEGAKANGHDPDDPFSAMPASPDAEIEI